MPCPGTPSLVSDDPEGVIDASFPRALAGRLRRLADPDAVGARSALVGLAYAVDDPDELIDVLRNELHSPHDYVTIARALVDHGRVAEAIEWSQRGLGVFRERHSQSLALRELLAAMLRGTGRDDEALAVFWDAFELDLGLGTYQRLLDEVAPDTEPWRERALTLLRSCVSRRQQPDGARVHAVAALIDVLLAEGDADGGWETAKAHGCDRRRWLALAKARETTHPLEAIDIYEPEVFSAIDQKNNHGYAAAVDLLATIRRLAVAADATERFDAALRRARVDHKPKRNLQALLDRKKWPRLVP